MVVCCATMHAMDGHHRRHITPHPTQGFAQGKQRKVPESCVHQNAEQSCLPESTGVVQHAVIIAPNHRTGFRIKEGIDSSLSTTYPSMDAAALGGAQSAGAHRIPLHPPNTFGTRAGKRGAQPERHQLQLRSGPGGSSFKPRLAMAVRSTINISSSSSSPSKKGG